MGITFRDAVRGLRFGRGTSALSCVIFATAIAAGTVTFSVVDAIALRPLPFTKADRLVAVARIETGRARVADAAPQDYFAWSGRIAALESMAMYRNNVLLPMRRGAETTRLSIARVTTNFFDVLRARPTIGSLFTAGHDHAGTDAVVVLSHSLWTRAFGASPDVIGQSVMIGPVSRQVIGVLEPDVTYPVGLAITTDAYIPSIATDAERTDAAPGRTFNASIVARLKDDATVAQAQNQIDAINQTRGATSQTHRVMPLLDRVVGDAKSWLLLVLAGVACVVLVACVNVAGLSLARVTVRTRELATREVLGASRRHTIAVLLLEGLLLALASGIVGVGLSIWGLGVVTSLLPPGLARASTIAIDGRVLGVSLAVVVLCGMTFASAPAWFASRVDLFAATRAGGAIAGGRRRARVLGTFLAGEMAFLTLLLVTTALVATTFVVVTTIDMGFDRHNLFAIGVQPADTAPTSVARDLRAATFTRDLLARVRILPGVERAAFIGTGMPLIGGTATYGVGLPGENTQATTHRFEVREVSSGYFETTRLQLVRGRGIEASDGPGAEHVAVINEAAVHQYFGGADPLGATMTFRGPITIVGVVGDVRNFGPELAAAPQLYVSVEQLGSRDGDLIVRAIGDAGAVGASVRAAVREIVRDGDVFQPRMVEDAFSRATAGRRFNAGLMTAFGVIGLLIGAIGVYGTMSFIVAQDMRAIGVRLALGATRSRIGRGVFRDATRRIGAGVIAGLGIAWAASSLMTSLVFGIAPVSPLIYLAVCALLAVVALVAAMVPAIRAASVDPLVALRSE